MATLLPTLAGNGSRPAAGSADTPRGVPGNTGAAGAPAPPAPAAGATMTGSVIGGIGSSTAAAPTPGTTSITGGSFTGGIRSGGSCICGGSSGRPDGTSMAPPPPPPPPGAGSPGPGVEVDVVVSLVSVDVVLLVVAAVDVVLLVVAAVDVVRLVVGVVVFVLVDVSVLVDDEPGGLLCVLPPQCRAFPLLPSLPQLPLSGFPPLPGWSSAVSGVSWSLPVLAFEPPPPSESPFGPLAGISVECGPPGISEWADGSATANAPPNPHRNSPVATRQADAAPCTREPTSSPPSKASIAAYSQDPAILARLRETVCRGFESTRDRDRPIARMLRTIVLGCTLA
jgi:hypothetical protein